MAVGRAAGTCASTAGSAPGAVPSSGTAGGSSTTVPSPSIVRYPAVTCSISRLNGTTDRYRRPSSVGMCRLSESSRLSRPAARIRTPFGADVVPDVCTTLQIQSWSFVDGAGLPRPSSASSAMWT